MELLLGRLIVRTLWRRLHCSQLFARPAQSVLVVLDRNPAPKYFGPKACLLPFECQLQLIGCHVLLLSTSVENSALERFAGEYRKLAFDDIGEIGQLLSRVSQIRDCGANR